MTSSKPLFILLGVSIAILIAIVGMVILNANHSIIIALSVLTIAAQTLLLIKIRKQNSNTTESPSSTNNPETKIDTQDHNNIQLLCEKLSLFSQNEFTFAANELNNMKSIVNSASKSLGNNLSGLEEDSENQLTLLKNLVDELIQATSQQNEAEQQGMQQHSKESEKIVADLGLCTE